MSKLYQVNYIFQFSSMFNEKLVGMNDWILRWLPLLARENIIKFHVNHLLM